MTGHTGLPAWSRLPAALPCGDPDRLWRPRTARRLACWTGCHAPAGRVSAGDTLDLTQLFLVADRLNRL